MGQHVIKRTIKQAIRNRRRFAAEMGHGRVPVVAIIQERGTGKILAVGKDMEAAMKALNALAVVPALYDIGDFEVDL